MTSLADVYEGQVGEHADRRRLYLGVGSFCFGAVLAIAGIVIAGSEPTISALGLADAREYGGILAGIGVPAVFLGIFTVLPAGRVTRAAAVVGTGIALLGVSLFSHAYPCGWSGATCGPQQADLTLVVAAVYSLGVLTTFWCLFVGVANFKSRNDPGGTVELEVTRNGETKVIEVPESELESEGAGGIGFFGDQPDGDVATQTAGSETGAGAVGASHAETEVTRTDSGASDGLSSSGRAGSSTGGVTATDGSVPEDGGVEVLDDSSSGPGAAGDSGPTPTDGFGASGGTRGSPSEPNAGGSPSEPNAGGSPSEPSAGGWPSEGTARASDGGPGGVETDSGPDRSPLEDVDDVSGSIGPGVTDETTAGSARGASTGPSTSRSGPTRDSNEINEVEPSEVANTPADSYCGSCAHFQYVRTENGMQPYCGYHDEVMDDMDACSEWTPR